MGQIHSWWIIFVKDLDRGRIPVLVTLHLQTTFTSANNGILLDLLKGLRIGSIPLFLVVSLLSWWRVPVVGNRGIKVVDPWWHAARISSLPSIIWYLHKVPGEVIWQCEVWYH